MPLGAIIRGALLALTACGAAQAYSPKPDLTAAGVIAASSGAFTITPGTPTDQVRVVIPNLDGKVFARLKVTQ
jgi:hypothetical protein